MVRASWGGFGVFYCDSGAGSVASSDGTNVGIYLMHGDRPLYE